MVHRGKREFVGAIKVMHQYREAFAAALQRLERRGGRKDWARCLSLLADYLAELAHCNELYLYDVADRVEKIERWIERGPKLSSRPGARRPLLGGTRWPRS
jgi:hypothetical protein